MKRLPEFILGLVGGIIGVIMSLLGFLLTIGMFETGDSDGGVITLILTIGFFFLQVAGLIIGCFANRMNNKVFGGIMIGIGVLSFPASLLTLFVPAVLYIVAGALAFRELKPKQDDIPFREDNPLM